MRVSYTLMNSTPEIPSEGPALLICGPLRPGDLPLIEKRLPRIPAWIVDQTSLTLLEEEKACSGILPRIHAAPLSEGKELAKLVEQKLEAGELVVIAPVADFVTTLAGLPSALAEWNPPNPPCPVIPVWMDSMWNEVLTGYPGARRLPADERIVFAPSLPPSHGWYGRLVEQLMEMGTRALTSRPELQTSLGWACLHGLHRRQNQVIITDAYQNDRTLKGGMLLAVGIEFMRWIRAHIPERHVGIVLPPGIGAWVANLACALAGKVPVNLNFTAGPAANKSAIRQAGIGAIITAQAVIDKVPDFPWTSHRHDIGDILKSIPKGKFVLWRGLIAITPAKVLARMLGVPRKGGASEAGLLFTSGSSGEPKGVPLSHRNILGNVAQVHSVLSGGLIDSMLGSLPVFHSFGFTVTMWWPMICGPRTVTYITPLETRKLADAIRRYSLQLLITTPTFLRSFLKRASREELAPLKMVVTGAEKLPLALLEEFEQNFDTRVFEGYGMTEATPVVSVNLPEVTTTATPSLPAANRRRIGSVGRPLPGQAVRVTHLETGATLLPGESGMLWFKGPNVFSGYLHNEELSFHVLKNGWYCSGDVGKLDLHGFLYIEGRLSRFSKIAGEMVPHGTIEVALNEAGASLAADPGDTVSSVVVGLDDPVKGEILVALTTSTASEDALRRKLSEAGLPNLWIPKAIRQVPEIPTLASGKLDLQSAKNLACGQLEPE